MFKTLCLLDYVMLNFPKTPVVKIKGNLGTKIINVRNTKKGTKQVNKGVIINKC